MAFSVGVGVDAFELGLRERVRGRGEDEAGEEKCNRSDRIGNQRCLIPLCGDLATLLFQTVALAVELGLLGVNLRLELGKTAVLLGLNFDELDT